MRTLAILFITLLCVEPLLAQPSEVSNSGTDRGIFSGTYADAVWTMAAFVVLLLVLGSTAWKPMLKILKNREERIKQQLDTADITRKQAELMFDDYKQQGLQIVEKATEKARQLEKTAIDKGGQEIIAMKRKAQGDIEYLQLAASQQLWEQAGNMLLTISSEILGRAVTHEDNQRLIYEAIKRLEQEQSGKQL
jgi:F-type H+-transporting ATPase subunit b